MPPQADWRTIPDAIPQIVWSANSDGIHDYFNDRWHDFTGIPKAAAGDEARWHVVHPADVDLARVLWREVLKTGEPYEIRYRLRHHSGEYHWSLCRAHPLKGAGGEIERWFGTCTDIHALMLAESQLELVSRELTHRIKNIFAVVGGLTALTARGYPEAQSFVRALRQRFTSLAQAYDILPASGAGRSSLHPPGQSMMRVVRAVLEPYGSESAGHPIRITGDDPSIGSLASVSIALILHELATNAVKYGALSLPDGAVEFHCDAAQGNGVLTWIEHGGPAINTAPELSGFGSVVLNLATAQIGATLSREWRSDGLSVRLEFPLSHLAA